MENIQKKYLEHLYTMVVKLEEQIKEKIAGELTFGEIKGYIRGGIEVFDTLETIAKEKIT